ncbi:MAG: hypothetical protein PHG82_04075 [Candidatus Gracilibacteria bacterium]|nr:hypothetical protein [Candidatus Gracilibacteria bacterium]
MSNINIDKNTISDLNSRGIKNIKVFFYSSGCAGTKVNIEENPDVSDLELLENLDGINIFASKEDLTKLKGGTITKVMGKYIFSSQVVKSRCGCGSSFSFEDKGKVLALHKLKDLKLGGK